MQCGACKYCVYRAYGYSNYTVEGTTKECGRGVHKPFDNFYQKAPEYKNIPDPCPSWAPGEPLHLDVDGEVWESLTEEEKEIAGHRF